MIRAPKPDEPSYETFTLDDFCGFMSAYWGLVRFRYKKRIWTKFTMGSLVIVLLDYIRIRLFNYLL